jgi:hypothetical protein
MRLELTGQEANWLADLCNKEKNANDLANKETPHPLLELRRDNMAALENKLNAAIKREHQKERNNAR